MWSIFFLIAVVSCLSAAAWFVFLWAVGNGQFEDPEGPKYRMLEDDLPDDGNPPGATGDDRP
ncbi:MAG: cbb3-type cytochrome oxidase assembly protein CcoS [Nitrospirae bacterium]|nr:cbb3-type cytochrome oxidase assembly protein CcoS [Nitrospirota bacterium]